mmetsp:Transcript_11469/g.22521  ORF Transcript_11469/g.22521 Transcript_11469/m.22521 type:complete len:292 (+) Transcript_11469:1156-2031(+)
MMIKGSDSSASLSTRTSLATLKPKLPIQSDSGLSRSQDESKCYLCDTSFTFLGSRRRVCHFCKQSVCDEHSRGKKENERVCDACSRQMARRDLKSSDEHDQIHKLKLQIELEIKAREERRLENQRKEAEIAKLKLAISNSNGEFEVAQQELEAKIEQEVQRVQKHQQIVSNLQQALDDVKSSKRLVESKLAEIEIQIDTVKTETNVLETRKREVEAAIADKTTEIKNSIPFYQLKTLICRSCKKYLRQNQDEALFKHVSSDNLKSFLGTHSTLPLPSGNAQSTNQCNCMLM